MSPASSVSTSAAALAVRRARLANALGDAPALIFSGQRRPRNYPKNPYPFRAESHFLYLVGDALPGAALLVDGPRATLFVEPSAPDDIVWHGAVATFAELRATTGLDAITTTDRLADAIAALPIDRRARLATLPANEESTAQWQSTLLGRPIRAGHGNNLGVVDAPLAEAMIALRLTHDDAAIAQMRAAVAVTRSAHLAGARALRPGVREALVCAAIEAEFTANSMCPAYGSIVTTRGEVLHNDAHHHVVEAGDLLLVDAGAESTGGWASDVTRVYPASGKFSPTQRAIYDVVLAANRAAIAKVAPGARYRDVHLEAGATLVRGLVELGIFTTKHRSVDALIESGAHTIFFPHGVGHLLGLDVHDMEDLGDRAGYAPGRTRSSRFGDAYLRLDRDLAPGMAVTIEPGFYRIDAILDDAALAGPFADDLDRATLDLFKDVRGIRLEDDVLVTATGREVLTRDIPIEARAIEEWMRG
ncbi:MAG: aminopeptidase P family protein [Polyangiales bacterium]